MRRFGQILLGLGAAVGAGIGVAIGMHAGLMGASWVVNVAVAKLGLVASACLMAGGAMSLRLARRREQPSLPREREQ